MRTRNKSPPLESQGEEIEQISTNEAIRRSLEPFGSPVVLSTLPNGPSPTRISLRRHNVLNGRYGYYGRIGIIDEVAREQYANNVVAFVAGGRLSSVDQRCDRWNHIAVQFYRRPQ